MKVVIYHGARAHWVAGHENGDVVAFCGMRMSQTRPAIRTDRTCRNCLKELRKIKNSGRR